MNNPKSSIHNSFKNEFGRFFIISFGAFLFILFFQPFPLEMLDYDNRLLFVTGFWAITFILACIVLIFLPLLIPKFVKISEWENGPPFILSLLFMVFTAAAFAFYIRYVGMVMLTLYIMFKVLLVCLLPLIILIFLYKTKSQERVINFLREQNKHYLSKINEYEKIREDEETLENEEFEIVSDNKFDKLTLKYQRIISIKSADNYIEIFYLENDSVEKKLVRNTLKNIELQLANKSNFARCHRTAIVNVLHINKLERSYNGFNLNMKHLEESIPVSRQYLIQIKEAISTLK